MGIYPRYGAGTTVRRSIAGLPGSPAVVSRNAQRATEARGAMFGKLFRMTVNRQTRTCPARCGALSTRRDRGGVSRAAKGADCKSAGLAFVGSSPTSPTKLKLHVQFNAATNVHGQF